MGDHCQSSAKLFRSTAAQNVLTRNTYRLKSDAVQVPAVNHDVSTAQLHCPENRLSHATLPSACPPNDPHFLARSDVKGQIFENQR